MNSKSKNIELPINVYNILKSIISTLKSFLTNILKTSIAMSNIPLKTILVFAIGILNYKLLDDKYQSISRIDSKGNKYKIPAEKSKKYIITFIYICNSLLYLIHKREELAYKILIFFIIKEYVSKFINFTNIDMIKPYLINIYANDTFIKSNIINKLSVNEILNFNFIYLLSKIK